LGNLILGYYISVSHWKKCPFLLREVADVAKVL
jgi:hypothetical protein